MIADSFSRKEYLCLHLALSVILTPDLLKISSVQKKNMVCCDGLLIHRKQIPAVTNGPGFSAEFRTESKVCVVSSGHARF